MFWNERLVARTCSGRSTCRLARIRDRFFSRLLAASRSALLSDGNSGNTVAAEVVSDGTLKFFMACAQIRLFSGHYETWWCNYASPFSRWGNNSREFFEIVQQLRGLRAPLT